MFNKVLLGATGTTIAVGGGVGTYLYLNKDEELPKIEKSSVSELLVKEKYTPLTDQNSGEWNKILESYKEVIKKHNALKFDDFNGEGADAINTLKTKCSVALGSKDEKLLNKAKKWCVTPVKASDLLTARGINVLKTDGATDSGEEPKWKKRIEEFKEAKKQKTSLKSLIDIKEPPAQDAENITVIKGKCKAFGEVLNHTIEFEENLSNLQLWCTDK